MEEKTQKPETAEDAITEVAEALQVEMPKVKMPPAMKIVTVFTLIGGLSIVGSLFVNIVQPNDSVSGPFYILQIFTGVIALSAGYSIIKKSRAAFWLYALITAVALYLNPITALVPGLVSVYLYRKRTCFRRTKLDILLRKILDRINKQ